MTLPVNELKAAIRTLLLADSTLTGLLGGPRLFDEVPRGQALPYIVFGEAESRDVSTNSGRAQEVFLVLAVLSGQGGTKEAQGIASRLDALLHDAALTLPSHRLISLALQSITLRRERNLQTTRAALRLRAYTEQI